MKNLFILLLLSFNLFGANYINEFPTYTYGDIRPIAAIYNSIAMITNSDIYENLIQLALLFSVVSIGWLLIFNKDLVSALKGGSFTIGTVAVMLVPVDVHLVDKRLDKGLITNYYHDNTLGYEKISNVPWLIALTPSIATTISSDLIELSDQAFKGNTVNYAGMQDIGKLGFSDLGYNKPYDMLNKIIDKYSFDELGTLDASNFKRDFKIYLADCVIPKTVSNTQATTKLINPDKDIFSALSPIEIGLTNTDELSKRDGTITDCVSFYSEIMNNLKGLTTDTYTTLSKIAGTPDIKQLTGFEHIMLADIQSTVFSNTTEQLAIYAQNIAATPLIKEVMESYYRGTNVSGQEVANQITAAKSSASLQTQGLGQFKWMAQILPYAMHFLFGIVLASSIFTLIMILGRGTFHGTIIAKNYFGGFIQFEAIRVALSIVNNLTMYYATINAADKLVEFGGNPLATTKIPAYLDYIATMEGVSGILAISAIFLIPAIAMKGDVASIASSMQGLSGRYVGNDVETARDAVSKSSARQRAVGNIMNDEQAMKKLDQMGLSVPKDRMPLEYYNAVTNDLANMSAGIGNMLSHDNMNNFSKGTVASTVSKVASTAGYGSSVSMASAESVSYQDGQAQGYQTNATEKYRSKSNWDANSVGTGRAIQSVGKDLSTMATTDLASSDEGFSSFAKGSYNQGAISTAKTQGAGGLNLSTDDLNKIGDTVKASIQSEIGKGAGVQENYKKYGENTYRDSAEYGERSGMAKTMEKLKAQNGIDNAVTIDANESMMKAYQQTGSVEGNMDAYSRRAKGSGRTMGEIIEALSKDLSEGKTSSDIATVDYANANGGYVNFMVKSANEKISTSIATLDGKTGSMIDESGKLTESGKATVTQMSEGKAKSDIRTVSEYNKNYSGGYVQAQLDNASIKAGQDISNIDAQKDKGFIDNDGMTEKGMDAYGIRPIEQANALEGIYNTFYGKNSQTAANNVVNELKNASKRSAKMEASNLAKDLKLDEEKTKNFIDSYVQEKMQDVDKKMQELGMLNDKGEVQSGDAMVGALAKMGSMNYASSKTLTFDGMDINMGIDSSTGQAKIHKANASRDVSAGNSDNFNSLNSSITGNKKENFDNVDVEKKGEQLNYDPLIDLVGNDAIGEIAKGVLQGAAVLGALDVVTGGKVRERISNAKEKFKEYKNQKTGEVNGKGDNDKEKTFNPGNRTDVEEYLDNNKGAKSRVNYSESFGSNGRPVNGSIDDLDGSVGREPDGPKYPQSDATAKATTNNTPAQTNPVNISDSLNNNNNYSTNNNSVPTNFNEKSLNEQKNDLVNKNPDDLARETFKNQAQMKLNNNLNEFRAGNIDAQTFGKRNADLSSFMSKVNSGADISMKDLKGVDIKPTQDLPIETKMSKNNKPYEVIDTKGYGEQLKEIEAQKIRVAEENLSKFDSNGNPKVEVLENSTNKEISNDIVDNNIKDIGSSNEQLTNKEIGEKDIKERLNDRRKIIDEAYKNGEMKINEYENQKTKLNNIEKRMDDGKTIHTNKLEQAGINTKDIPHSNGVVDIETLGNKLSKSNIEHPKIENFMTEAEAKTSGAMDMFKKIPLIGKVAGVALAGATFAEANEAFNQGQYAKALFTVTSIADVTGGSDLALATIESRELQKQALGNRTITGIGNGWQDDLKNSSIGKQITGAYDSVSNMFSNNIRNETQQQVQPKAEQVSQITTAPVQQANPIVANNPVQQPITTENFANTLKEGQVRNELGSIYKEQIEQSQLMSGNEEQMKNLQMMEMRNNLSNVQEQMKTLSDINISGEELEQLKKDLKKMRMKGGNN